MRYQFNIQEKAIGKQRPRYSSRTHKMYTPTATRSFEEKVRWAFTSKYNIETELSTKPISAIIKVYYEPATSLSDKKKNSLYGQPYAKTPDTDNIAKAILDSLNGLAYKDDSQVTSLVVDKYYGKENLIEVDLEEINE